MGRKKIVIQYVCTCGNRFDYPKTRTARLCNLLEGIMISVYEYGARPPANQDGAIEAETPVVATLQYSSGASPLPPCRETGGSVCLKGTNASPYNPLHHFRRRRHLPVSLRGRKFSAVAHAPHAIGVLDALDEYRLASPAHSVAVFAARPAPRLMPIRHGADAIRGRPANRIAG